jgi:hypothetical protein
MIWTSQLICCFVLLHMPLSALLYYAWLDSISLLKINSRISYYSIYFLIEYVYHKLLENLYLKTSISILYGKYKLNYGMVKIILANYLLMIFDHFWISPKIFITQFKSSYKGLRIHFWAFKVIFGVIWVKFFTLKIWMP